MDNNIEYRLIRSKRRTISVEITPELEVVVRAPKRCSITEIEAFVNSRKSWIVRHLKSMERRLEELERQQNELGLLAEDEIDTLTAEARFEIHRLVSKWAPIVLGEKEKRIGLIIKLLPIP